MVYLTLLNSSFKNIHMTIDFDGEINVNLDSTVSFDVDYNSNNTGCLARIRHVVSCKDDPEKFNISVEGTGEFSCEGINSTDDKREAHIRAYSLLFPYVQSIITRLTVDAGIMPLRVDMAKFRVEEVQVTGNK